MPPGRTAPPTEVVFRYLVARGDNKHSQESKKFGRSHFLKDRKKWHEKRRDDRVRRSGLKGY